MSGACRHLGDPRNVDSARDAARNLLALEDSHGFGVLIGAITPQDMVRLL